MQNLGFFFFLLINVRECRKGNKKWTIQRNWQHRVHKTNKKQNKNTTQYVLDTTSTQTKLKVRQRSSIFNSKKH
jgi:hypothetical protein